MTRVFERERERERKRERGSITAYTKNQLVSWFDDKEYH